ncbi:hypothetical protein ABZ079_17005 [Streptomyces sp. NPDC006314]|uniref:hypothetical protein n=1 Tax=Streptomyces sp. NPDC006314 TaxID=3154475 RepID=UPI0033A34DE7
MSRVAFCQQIARRPELLDPDVQDTYVRHGRLRSWAGALAYTVAGLLGVLIAPLLEVAVFVMLPVYYFVTTKACPAAGTAPPDTGRAHPREGPCRASAGLLDQLSRKPLTP